MKLEVNEYYLTEDGRIIQIVNKCDKYNYIDNDDYFYTECGLNDRLNTSRNLIAHIPKPLHQFLLQQINDYYVDEDFRLTVKSVFGDKND